MEALSGKWKGCWEWGRRLSSFADFPWAEDANNQYDGNDWRYDIFMVGNSRIRHCSVHLAISKMEMGTEVTEEVLSLKQVLEENSAPTNDGRHEALSVQFRRRWMAIRSTWSRRSKSQLIRFNYTVQNGKISIRLKNTSCSLKTRLSFRWDLDPKQIFQPFYRGRIIAETERWRDWSRLFNVQQILDKHCLHINSSCWWQMDVI